MEREANGETVGSPLLCAHYFLLINFFFSSSSSALFSAVEHGHLEKARTILESTDVNVNSVNSDGLSPLDVALLSNNRPMTKMLQQRGAKEAFQCE